MLVERAYCGVLEGSRFGYPFNRCHRKTENFLSLVRRGFSLSAAMKACTRWAKAVEQDLALMFISLLFL
jgi:hypothetical protein